MGLGSKMVLPKGFKLLWVMATSLEEVLSLKGPLHRDEHRPIWPVVALHHFVLEPQNISFHISSSHVTCCTEVREVTEEF